MTAKPKVVKAVVGIEKVAGETVAYFVKTYGGGGDYHNYADALRIVRGATPDEIRTAKLILGKRIK